MFCHIEVQTAINSNAQVRSAPRCNTPLAPPAQNSTLPLVLLRQLLDLHTTEKLHGTLLRCLSNDNHNVITSALETLQQVCHGAFSPRPASMLPRDSYPAIPPSDTFHRSSLACCGVSFCDGFACQNDTANARSCWQTFFFPSKRFASGKASHDPLDSFRILCTCPLWVSSFLSRKPPQFSLAVSCLSQSDA